MRNSTTTTPQVIICIIGGLAALSIAIGISSVRPKHKKESSGRKVE